MARPAKIQEVKSFDMEFGANRMSYKVRVNLTGYTKIGKIDATDYISIDRAVRLINDLKKAVLDVKTEVNRVAAQAGV